jgi:hypothetical protein
MIDIQSAILQKIFDVTINNAGRSDEKTVAALWAELAASGVSDSEMNNYQKIVRDQLLVRELLAGRKVKSIPSVASPRHYDGLGRAIDFHRLVHEASSEEVDRYLLSFDSYKRAEALVWLMSALPRVAVCDYFWFGATCAMHLGPIVLI